jgi:hypothetical protein
VRSVHVYAIFTTPKMHTSGFLVKKTRVPTNYQEVYSVLIIFALLLFDSELIQNKNREYRNRPRALCLIFNVPALLSEMISYQ